MADNLTKAERSWNMSRIKSGNTKPELAVRSILHRMGYRFSLHKKSLPGKPDIILPKHKCVIFVHGCFWHRHKGCKEATNPKTRIQFWKEKFRGNVIRDKRNQKELRKNRWRFLVIWECEINKKSQIINRIKNFLG
jgi:DNA mismatch endonuclease (patch repair protein)